MRGGEGRPVLILGGCLNAGVMTLYSLLLLYNNTTRFAPPLRPSPLRIGALIWAFVFYGYFTVLTLKSVLSFH